ncbi:hypothetical protein DEM34_00925 [Spiribacter halobius]|uniref:Uncharacterized protein n=1 Tax=Sediminicurvatus halobius TaxID=2182432 RepID=A0A2U2N9S5_9GAMM|nr:hypothetical protein DEM34_00925 [Spiribacter halobius]
MPQPPASRGAGAGGGAAAFAAPVSVHAHIADGHLGATAMNNIIYIVGFVVIVLAILSFLGLR